MLGASFSISARAADAGLATSAATSPAASTAAVALDIPAGPLATTLTRIGQQQGRAIVADPALIAGRQAPAIRGVLSADDAVRQALGNSDLTVDVSSSGALGIRRRTAADAASVTPAAQPAVTSTLPTVTVTTQRFGGELMQPTRQVTVIEDQELDALRATSPNLATMLTKSVPGLSDSSRNLTDFGQTLRGRNVLVLVDGIPLNTNRDSSRNLINIEPGRIQRIEVMRGSNAIYGSGASGGIVSVTTRPVGGEPVVETTVSMDAALSHLSREGLGAQVQQYFSGRGDVVDYEIDASYRRIGGSFDGNGDRIAPDASQGDLFDSNTYSIGGKIGLRIDANQRLQFAASYLRARQQTDYASDPTVSATPLGSTTARAIKGLDLAEQNQVENAMLSVNYDNKDVLGSSLSVLGYVRDNSTRFAPSDSRTNTNRGNNVDQVLQNNKVFGGRVTIDTPFGADRDTRLVWGTDFIQERSNMPLDVFDPAIYDASRGLVFRTTRQQTYLPWTTTRSLGLFGQLQHKFNDMWSAEGGLRYERASASFDDFQPLSQSRRPNPVSVRGGEVTYDATMFNAGLVFKPVTGHELYTSFSQGFDLPDVGLQLRNAQAGFSINSSQLEPVKTDNYELGWRGRFGNTMGSLAVFRSTSDLGAVQSFNNGLTLTRTQERIHGVEATIDHYSDDDVWATGGTLTWMEGRETPQGATQDRIMTGYRIPPLKLTGYVQYQPSDRWSTRMQLTWFGARDYRLADGRTQFARADVKSYYTVDLVTRYKLNKSDTITVGVQNLFNRQYLPLYSQLLRSGNNNSRLPAAGAVLTASYTHRW
ncbi:TonB-dependent receptor [Pigmentiphaga aceris]|uniref:TonB-dependent receptor n=2 Tax=Pigmentiphaga aceris TaxID=1940612 RepID=A0A5C0B7L8_9BURK|nr:TonB-dependent receptor [Pigmentiphaga aceris]